MGTDLEQFYQIFFEEADELLAEMEIRLLGLDIQSPDLEDLNAIFRVAHSIKGGAGTFGFSDMTELTHLLESLLDKLRKNELALRSEMIDVFLQARDVLKQQLDAHQDNGVADSAEMEAVALKLRTLVAEATSNITSSPSSADSTAATVDKPVQTESADGASTTATYRVIFSCDDLRPAAMDQLLIDLALLGKLENLSDPSQKDQCTLRLTSMVSEEDIWEALAFVVDPTGLSVEAEKINQPDNSASLVDLVDSNNETQEKHTQAENIALATTDTQQPSGALENIKEENVVTSSATPPSSHKQVTTVAKTSKSARNENAKATSSESSSIRVSIEKVDQMINLVGELVITQAMLAQTASQIDPVLYEKLFNGLSQLERNTRDLQEAVMSIRMLPISFVFSRFPRVIRDVASKLGKRVELKTIGEGTELDKGLIEKITDPLTHLIRNSLDHGIESPEKRKSLGKPEQGTITLRASHQGGSVVIEVMDDGAGLSRERILNKAHGRGLAVSDTMPDQDVWMLIFDAGFSTADVVTDVSGRGVGMDVVKRNIQELGGRVEIDSVQGSGTKISIRLPLTLAILDGLSVSVGDQMFIIPLAYITESLKPTDADIRTIRGQGRVVQVRGEYLPVIALHEIFGLEPAVQEIHEGILVILDAEGSKAAMFVDALIGQHQVVIKSLEHNYRRVPGVSAATIMGDGSVALILDAVGLVNITKQKAIHAA